MRNLLLIFAMPSLLGTLASPACARDTFFLRVGAGGSFPLLKNLNDELVLQGNKKVQTGYSLGMSLGRTFAEMQWSLELHFSAASYPGFDYINPLDSFPGRMRHYSYLVVLERHFRPEGKLFKPSLGAGIGYGQTNLVSGGGKLGAAEALVTGRIDSEVRDNIDLSLECLYYTGLQSKEFGKPFLENVDTDMVVNSAGEALKDTFRSLDVRVGVTVRLRQMMTQ